jgi:hypothetical protein
MSELKLRPPKTQIQLQMTDPSSAMRPRRGADPSRQESGRARDDNERQALRREILRCAQNDSKKKAGGSG